MLLGFQLLLGCSTVQRMSKKIKRVDIVMGGDHSQESFQLILSIIVRRENLEDIIDDWIV